MTPRISLNQQIEELHKLETEIARDLRRWARTIGVSEREAEYRLGRLRAARETLTTLGDVWRDKAGR